MREWGSVPSLVFRCLGGRRNTGFLLFHNEAENKDEKGVWLDNHLHIIGKCCECLGGIRGNVHCSSVTSSVDYWHRAVLANTDTGEVGQQ
jgi:hypothetical protein